MENNPPSPEKEKPEVKTIENKEQTLLLISIFFISVCGISYELLFGTVSSYLLGDTILQFSLVIGIFMSSMGLGSYISRYIEKNLLDTFIHIEIWIGITGGFAAAILFFAFACTESYSFIMYLLLIVVGTLVGLEIPLVTRIVKEYGTLKITLARVLSLDYLGALAAAILFPVVLLPYLGLMQSSFFFGLLNMGVTIANIIVFYKKLISPKKLLITTIISVLLLTSGLIFSYKIVSFFEGVLYQGTIVYTLQTKYQRIVLTKWKKHISLFLDGNLQFSTIDEYRYHETLIHPAMSLAPSRENVLIIGGGDGLAAREILKYEDVKTIKIVDIDPEMVNLCATHGLITKFNENSLKNPKVKYIAEDGWVFIKNSEEFFDIIILDLPDPRSEQLSKLYSKSFYLMLGNHLSRGGMICIQSSSVFFTPNTYWCIYNTLEDAGFYVKPMHTLVPTFGDWGFVLASNEKLHTEDIKIKVSTRYLNEDAIKDIFKFSKDISWRDTEISTINNSMIMYYYIEDWTKWQ